MSNILALQELPSDSELHGDGLAAVSGLSTISCCCGGSAIE